MPDGNSARSIATAYFAVAFIRTIIDNQDTHHLIFNIFINLIK